MGTELSNTESTDGYLKSGWKIEATELPNSLPSLEQSGATVESVEYFNEALKQFSAEEQIKISAAARFFSLLHKRNNQTRPLGNSEKEQYANHILRVASRLVNEFGITDSKVVIAALGHDSLEDLGELLTGKTDATREETTLILTEYLGKETTELIEGVTNPVNPDEDKLSKDEKKRLYAEHVIEAANGSSAVKAIKFSDFIDNGLNVSDSLPSERKAHFAQKYLALCVYFDECLEQGQIITDADKRREWQQQVWEAEKNFLQYIVEEKKIAL